ncbi:2-oxo acid dehydrogenase subunit E2 [Nonomuraea sp. NPDC049714]|uniref:dihydrolipoamide acetyltransferase family protein n=1 Tax=Nonomuraea sp. NPDC049714 TaxID=3364357 RepID=UPI0037987E0C
MTTTATGQVFRLPDLGEGLTEAEIVAWKVAVGDTVEIDQIVVEVETAKAAVEVPVPYAGTVLRLHAEPGAVLPVGTPLIEIGPATPTDATETTAPGDTASAAGAAGAADRYREEERAGSGNVLIGYGTAPTPTSRRRHRHPSRTPTPRQPPDPTLQAPEPARQAPQPVRPPSEPARQTPQPARRPSGPARQAPGPAGQAPEAVRPSSEPAGQASGSEPAPAPDRAPGQAPRVISPLVRRIAREHGVDLAAVNPTGPRGVILRRDVERAIADAGTPPPTVEAPPTIEVAPAAERVPLRGLRRAVADKVTRSRNEIPDATTWVDVDATALLTVRDALRRARPDLGIGLLAILARVCVAGLRRFPELNSSVDTGRAEIVRHGHINLGFAAQTDRGLMVPVVRDAHLMTTAQLAAELARLTGLARAGESPPSALTGGTFTLNNYGVFGVDGSTPIINHPEAALLGVGRIIDRPWVTDGTVAPRKIAQLSLTFDHRVCDGAAAGGFLRFVADCVENPAILLAHV